MSQYFPKPYEAFGGSINVKVDLSNYATKADNKNISHIDTSSFALKTNLYIDKLVPLPVDLSKLSDVVKNDVVKKDVYDKLVAKLNSIDTSRFVLKTKYDTNKTKVENKILHTNDLVKKTDYNTKITEIESKIPDISNLTTKTALPTVESKITSFSNLVKKTDYNTKVIKIENKLDNHNHDKYIDTSEFNKLATHVFNARIAQANLITKTAKRYFEEDGTPHYLVFQPLKRYFKISNSDYVLSLKSKGLSTESITPPTALHNFLNPSLNHLGTKVRVRFSGSCLKQSKISYAHEKVVNIYIVYEVNKKDNIIISNPTLENCLFGAATLTKHVNIDKYGYSGYGIGFDRRSSFSFPGGGYDQNVLIFGVDMSFSTHIDNKKKKHISSQERTNTRSRTYANCRKNVFR